MLPINEAPGLAIGLGGVGVTLRDLVQLYTGLANGGKRAARCATAPSRPMPSRSADGTILDDQANWQITDILSGVKPPEGASQRGIAYKTGTSYGYRDAWSVGFDGRYVLGVWVGRADSGSVPGLSGYVSAAPILFEASPLRRSPPCRCRGRRPARSRPRREDLPVTLARFGAAPRGWCSRSADRARAADHLSAGRRPRRTRRQLGRCLAAGAEAARRPRAVPLAGQRQAAAEHRAPPHRDLAA